MGNLGESFESELRRTRATWSGVLCEEPEAFKLFMSLNAKKARETANSKGLVAVLASCRNCLGGVRVLLYWAIPSGFAERIVDGVPVVPANPGEADFLERLVEKGKAKALADMFWVTDFRLMREMRSQLHSIAMAKRVRT